MKGIKMDKIGVENNQNNNDTFEMLTRKVDGETCLDVECGPNKAVLYLSKLFGGSKTECILHGDDWLTPNGFQKRSGRGSAKDWKRSIRHNGVSLKTFISSGILEIPADSKLRLRGGKQTGIDSNQKSKKGHTPFIQIQNTRIGLPNADLKISSVGIHKIIKDKQKKNAKRKKDVREHEVEPDKNNIPVVEEPHIENNAFQRTTDTVDNLDGDCDAVKPENLPNDEVGEQKDNSNANSANPEKETCNIPKESTESQIHPSIYGGTTIKTNKQNEILVSNKLSVDPYEMTVTPPPTPPNQAYGATPSNQAYGEGEHGEQSRTDNMSEANPVIQTIKYKPYLLAGSENMRVGQERLKGDNRVDYSGNPYLVTSPSSDSSSSRTERIEFNDDNQRHSVIVTSPMTSPPHHGITVNRQKNKHTSLLQYDLHHLHRLPTTSESGATDVYNFHRNINSKIENNFHRNVNSKSDDIEYPNQTYQFSAAMDKVRTGDADKYFANFQQNSRNRSLKQAAVTRFLLKSDHLARKRNHYEVEQDEPLDLSMKKRKVQDQDIPQHKSRDDHVIDKDQSNIRISDKTTAPSMNAIFHPMKATHFPKYAYNTFHPLFQPLRVFKYEQHDAEQINPLMMYQFSCS